MLINDVVRLDREAFRVIDMRDEQAALCSLTKPALPPLILPLEAVSKAEMVEDPYVSLRARTPEGRALAKAEKNYKLIEAIVTAPHVAFDSELRNRLLREQSAGNASVRRQLSRQLLMYWQKGQTITALCPEYGKAKGERNNARKPGPKSQAGQNPPPVNAEIRKLFDQVCRKHLLQEDGVSVRRAYSLFTERYQAAHADEEAESIPTIHQFRYYYLSRFTPAERTARRVNSRRYRKDIRSLPGTVYDVVAGIGHTWSYDSTLADIHLVSTESREKKIARVRLEVITDDFSKMIVAARASLQSAQYKSALETLSIGVCSKKAFAERFGLVISEDAWPVRGIPQCLKGDNGELCTEQAAVLSRSLGLRIELTPPYRADSKGVVERMIGMIQEEFTHDEIAVPSKETLRKAGAKETRHQASLNLQELNRIIIRAAINLNNRALESLPPDFPAHGKDQLLRPIDVWNWAQATGRCYLRSFSSDDQMRIALLPRYEASFSREGIRVEGLRYWNDDAERKGWFDRSKAAHRPVNLSVALDPSDVSQAWLFPDDAANPSECWACRLHPDDVRYSGKSLTEAKEMMKQISANRIRTQQRFDIEAGKARKQTQDEMAQARSETAKPAVSVSATLADIPENRKNERIAEEKAGRIMPQMKDNSEKQSTEVSETDYSFPDTYDLPFMRST